MKNYEGPGEVLDLTANRTASAGAGMQIGCFFGVLVNDAVNGGPCQLRVEGKVRIAKTSALALAQGARVYWDNTNFVVNDTSTGQQEVGGVVEAAANPSATVLIKLIPTERTSVAA